MANLSAFDRQRTQIEEALRSNSINFNLLYNKYPQFDTDKFVFYISKDKNNSRNDKWLLGNKPIRKDEYEFFNAKTVAKTQTNHYQAIQDLGLKTNEKELSPEWRMNIGLGGESVYETGMTLHHIYGFPYIPATAIKGVAHHYANYLLSLPEDETHEFISGNEGKKIILDIFGSEDDKNPQKGKIIFFDAFPITNPILSPDIMNNHYPKYYDGSGKPPADWQSPLPIFFLTVKNTSFKFVLGIKPKDEKDNPELLKQTIDLLSEALMQKGIGAKTAVGYGYMQ